MADRDGLAPRGEVFVPPPCTPRACTRRRIGHAEGGQRATDDRSGVAGVRRPGTDASDRLNEGCAKKKGLFACACECRRVALFCRCGMPRDLGSIRGDEPAGGELVESAEAVGRPLLSEPTTALADRGEPSIFALEGRRLLRWRAPLGPFGRVSGRTVSARSILSIRAAGCMAYRASAERHDRRKQLVLVQCSSLLRDIFGNPFRPVAFSPSWRTDTAVSLARTDVRRRATSPRCRSWPTHFKTPGATTTTS